MSLPPNVVTRPGSSRFYYRESVPSDVRALLHARGERSKAEVWKSLATSNPQVAKRAVIDVRAAQHREWDTIRGKVAAPPTLHSPDEWEVLSVVTDIAFDQYRRLLVSQRGKLRHVGSDELKQFIETQRERLRRVSAQYAVGNLSQWEPAADAIITKRGWALPKSDAQDERTPEYRSLCHQLAEVWIDAHETNLRQLEGDAFAEPRSGTVKKAQATRQSLAALGESLIELFERYANQKREQREKSDDTLLQEQKVIELFTSFVGSRRAARSITKSDVREFRETLKALPIKHSSRKDYQGLSLREAAAKGKNEGLPTRSIRTVAKELSGISAFFSWMVREGFADENPTLGLLPRFDKKRGKLPPFRVDQLNAIFSSPLFTSCSGIAGKEHVPGDLRIRDWRFWLPLCAMFTGARIGELAQLLISDIQQIGCVWVFDLVEEEDDPTRRKSLKTQASRRIVPIHNRLIEFGLLDYVERMRATGAARLFPELIPNKRGHHAAGASRFWRTYLKRIGIKQPDDGLGSHSFRHTFVDELREHGVFDAVISTLVGHSKGTMTSDYGRKTEANLKQRSDAIRRLKFSGVSLDHLVA